MFSVPRMLTWGFLVALGLHAVAASSRAQAPSAEPQVSVLIVPRDTTKEIHVSSKLKISQARNENPKVARVQTKAEDPFAVLVTGLSPGTTRLILTDERKNVDAVDILVPEDQEIMNDKMRKQALDMIRKVAPTATVDIATPGSGTVIVSGYVQETQMIHPILDVARSVFGAANVVNNLRIGGVQQVQLECIVAVVNRSEARNLGHNFFANKGDIFLNSLLTPPVAAANSLATGIAAASATGNSSTNLSLGILNGKTSFTSFLSCLRSENLVKVLAEPRVVTLSGRPAYIVSGGEAPIVTSASGGSGVTYKQFGTVVNFLPVVLGNGKIHLEVRPEFSNIDVASSVSIATTGSLASAPGFRTRSAQASVMMEDGQTLAIGGLIQNTVTGTTNKVPCLGDLPFLGVCFRTVSYTETEEELLILVTPRLVDPIDCKQFPKHLPGRETRSPDDFELFLEGIMEAPRGQRNIFPDGKYVPAHLSSQTSGMYPCGDSPHPWSRQGRPCGPRGCTTGNVVSPYSMHGSDQGGHRASVGEFEDSAPSAGAPTGMPTGGPNSMPSVMPNTPTPMPTTFPGNPLRLPPPSLSPTSVPLPAGAGRPEGY